MVEEKRPGERITYTTRTISNEEVPRKIRYMQIIDILKKSTSPMPQKKLL